jgi:glycosyltransferase involved in cell wall biosynthesis
MASGLPVVSTDVGDVRLMVAGENLPHITRLDDTAMAAALAALVGDPAARRQIGHANLLKARRDFDEGAMFAAHGALWRGGDGTPGHRGDRAPSLDVEATERQGVALKLSTP